MRELFVKIKIRYTSLLVWKFERIYLSKLWSDVVALLVGIIFSLACLSDLAVMVTNFSILRLWILLIDLGIVFISVWTLFYMCKYAEKIDVLMIVDKKKKEQKQINETHRKVNELGKKYSNNKTVKDVIYLAYFFQKSNIIRKLEQMSPKTVNTVIKYLTTGEEVKKLSYFKVVTEDIEHLELLKTDGDFIERRILLEQLFDKITYELESIEETQNEKEKSAKKEELFSYFSFLDK